VTQFLAAALQENPELIDESLRQNVMLATPTSLVALLKAVAYGWKQSVLADNAAEIRRLGEDVYKRLAVFGDHLGRLGKSLGSSVESFNKAVGSWNSRSAGGPPLPGTRLAGGAGTGTARAHRQSHPRPRDTRDESGTEALDEPYRSRSLPPPSELMLEVS